MWVALAQAFCLMLVLEGIMPFIAPARWRNMAALLAQISDNSMRIIGFVSMLLGAVALYVLHAVVSV